MTKIRSLVVLSLALQACASNAAAQTRTTCDAILQYGIFDKTQTLDQRSKFELVQNAHCQSSARNEKTSGGLGYAEVFQASGEQAKSESEKFCASSFDQVAENQIYWNAVSRASTTIASAWQSCIQFNSAGVSHYIEPSSDPNRFSYKIIYTPDGEPTQVRIDEWVMTGQINCEGQQISKGTIVGSGGREIQCSRRPGSVIIVTVNTSGGTGTKNLRKIELPAARAQLPHFGSADGFSNISWSGDCNRRKVSYRDATIGTNLDVYLNSVSNSLTNCAGNWGGAINWGASSEQVLTQVRAAAGLDRSEGVALIDYSGDCNSRSFRVLDNATKRQTSVTVSDNCKKMDFTISPQKIAEQACAIGRCVF